MESEPNACVKRRYGLQHHRHDAGDDGDDEEQVHAAGPPVGRLGLLEDLIGAPTQAREASFGGRAEAPPSRRPERRLDGGERFRGLGAVGAAGLRHVGPTAAALAAELLGAEPDEIDRVEAAR